MILCKKTFQLAEGAGDMPLTHAIWVQSLGKIYGARGGFLFEFDASGVATGRQLAFGESLIGESCLALDTSGRLWASVNIDQYGYERRTAQGFYRIDLTSTPIGIADFIPWDGSYHNTAYPNSNFPDIIGLQNGALASGPLDMIFLSPTMVIFRTGDWRFGWTTYLWQADLSIPRFYAGFLGISFTGGGRSMYYDSANNQVWTISGLVPLGLSVQVPDNIPPNDFSWTPTAYEYFTEVGSNPATGAVYGFDYAPTVNNFFAVTRSTTVLVLNKTTPGGGFSVLNLAAYRPNMKPRNIRYSAWNQRLYIPTMQDNAVIELNAAGNVTNTFALPANTIPWDIVATDSKVFAVCLGNKGLVRVV